MAGPPQAEPAAAEPSEQFRVVVGECPAHGPRCTVLAFASLGGMIQQGIHLNEAALERVSALLGQRQLMLGVRG
jgi:hypothetical protein